MTGLRSEYTAGRRITPKILRVPSIETSGSTAIAASNNPLWLVTNFGPALCRCFVMGNFTEPGKALFRLSQRALRPSFHWLFIHAWKKGRGMSALLERTWRNGTDTFRTGYA